MDRERQIEIMDRAAARRIAALEETLGTLITWIAQTAGSPLSPSDAGKLLKKLTDAKEGQ